MEMSVREARAQFAAALSAAERGERVTITKHGKAVAELGPPTPASKQKWDWESLDRLQEELGIPKADPSRAPVEIDWEAEHAWSLEIFGLSDEPWDGE